MPNHVTNQITFKNLSIDEQIKILLENIDSKLNLDFNKTVFMPPELHIEESTYTYMGLALINKKYIKGFSFKSYEEVKQDFDTLSIEIQEKILKLGKQASINLEKYGVISWYDFAKREWGTKWNAYNFYILDIPYFENGEISKLKKLLKKLDSITFQFNTAWSCPLGWLSSFAKRYPNLDFEVKFFDEDLGRNCGIINFSNGKILSKETDSCHTIDINWTEFAFYLKYGFDAIPESYGYNSDWVYSEEVEENYREKQEMKRKLDNFD